jgi:hypothetical protein
MGARGSLARFFVGEGFSMETARGVRRFIPVFKPCYDARHLIYQHQLERRFDEMAPHCKWRKQRDHGGVER